MSSKRKRLLESRKEAAMAREDWSAARKASQELIDSFMREELSREERGEWKEMVVIARHLQDLQLEASAHRRIAELFMSLDEFKECLASAQSYQRLAAEMRDPVEGQRALVTKGRLYETRGQMLQEDGRKEAAGKATDEALDLYARAEEAAGALRGAVSGREKAEMRAVCLYNTFVIHQSRGSGTGELRALLNRMQQAIRGQQQLPLWHFRHALESAELAIKELDMGRAATLEAEAERWLRQLTTRLDEVNLVSFYVLKARLHLMRRSFRQARDLLIQAAAKHKQLASNREFVNMQRGVRKLLRLATTLERGTENEEEGGRQSLLEKLGDVASSLSLNQIAAKYYADSLECIGGKNLNDAKRAELYFSVACCQFEAGMYREALASFRTELDINRSRGKEGALETWARIVFTLRCLGQPYETMEKEVRDALSYARKRRLPAEEVRLLRLLSKLQADSTLYNEARESIAVANQIVEANDLSEDQLGDYEEVPQDVDVFSEEEEEEGNSDEEKGLPEGRQRRRRKVQHGRRNEFGETELHQLCKRPGNADAILHLIAKGVAVDVTDHNGWTPFLEACNYGQLEYVRILVEAGADLHWSGGEKDRVNGLIDACVLGHMDVAEYLLDHGARVFHQDKDGWLAVDHLEYWRKKEDKEITEEEKVAAEKLIARMHSALDKRKKSGQAIYVIPKKAVNTALQADGDDLDKLAFVEKDLGVQESHHIRRVRRRMDAGDYVDRQTKKRRVDENSRPLPKAAEEYRSVMASLRNKHDFVDNPPPEDFSEQPKKSRLAGGKTTSKSRQKRTRDDEPGQSTDDEELPDITEISNLAPEVEIPSSLPCLVDEDAVNLLEEESASTTAPSSFGQESEILVAKSNFARFTVVLEGRRMVVPLDLTRDDSVRHLAEITADRYATSSCGGNDGTVIAGACPVLKLFTKDGAELHEDDAATAVLVGESELVARVIKWDLPPLAERYAAACGGAGDHLRMRDVEEHLSECERTGRLELSWALGTIRATPVFRALAHTANLVSLSLSCNKLLDDGMRALAWCLPTLPSLKTLDLSQNGLSRASVGHLKGAVQRSQESGNNGMQQLRVLDLSFNCLLDASSSSILSLVESLSLDEIGMAACCLSNTSKEAILRIKELVRSVDVQFNQLSLD